MIQVVYKGKTLKFHRYIDMVEYIEFDSRLESAKSKCSSVVVV